MKIKKVWGVLFIVCGVLVLLTAVLQYFRPDQMIADKLRNSASQFGDWNGSLDRSGNFVKDSGSETIDVSKNNKLVLVDRAGKIHVTADPHAKRVTVNYEKGVPMKFSNADAEQRLQSIKVQITQQGDAARIETIYPNTMSVLDSGYVDFDITVPSNLAVDLQNNVGEITTEGLISQVFARSNAGRIQVNGFQDTADVHTNVGEVVISGGQSIKRIDASTNAGAVRVTLSASVNLAVDASTNVGAVNTVFPLTIEKQIPGSHMSGNIGSGQDGRVTLHTNTGEIQLNRE